MIGCCQTVRNAVSQAPAVTPRKGLAAEVPVYNMTNHARVGCSMKYLRRQPMFRLIFAVCAAVIAAGCGGPPYPTRVVDSERQVVDQLIGLGAGVRTDDAGHVTEVKFYFNPDRTNPEVTDADIACLTTLPKLRDLDLGPTNVSDNGFLEIIPQLRSLESLDAPYGLTDRGMVALSGARTLKVLIVGGYVTDEGLQSLSELSNLELLCLDVYELQGPGLKHLVGLPQLEHLHLTSSQVSSTELATLNQVSSLRELVIGGTDLDDQGLAAIHPTLTRLEVLQLGQTNLTDTGFEELKKLPNLRTLSLGGYCWQLAVKP